VSSATVTISDIIGGMAMAVGELRAALEAERVNDYPDAIANAQKALDVITNFPGGLDQLRSEIDRCPEQEKLRLRELLMKASVDHKVSGELIRIAMQKNAALQANVAQQSPAATYSGRGHVPGVLGSLLSRKV
jgi:hypothetical protein